ncbi:hypothetical protein ACN28C_27855 [Plantactinospora sp. WMMC1484]|uniref:hypothetical protein n=1 Tax=Plantactinospora sp. WMMC1484 TaxID=3404122 RepID=UPI003BF60BF7
MSLLSVTNRPFVNRFVLEQVTNPDNEMTLRGALLSATYKLQRGHYAANAARVIEAASAHWTHEGWNPDRLALTARRHLRYGDSAQVDATVDHIALMAQLYLGYDDQDRILKTIIRDAIFGIDDDQRLYSAKFLAATPFQVPVGRALMSLIESGLRCRDETLAELALPVLTRLGVSVHRDVVRQIITNHGYSLSFRTTAAWSLPHCSGRYPEPTWRSLLAPYVEIWQRGAAPSAARLIQGIAYGIGTDGHTALAVEISQDAVMPKQARRTAAWLLRERPSVA